MKRLIFILFALILFNPNAFCQNTDKSEKTTKLTRAEKKAVQVAQLASFVKQQISTGKIEIIINKIYAIGENARYTNDGYYIKINHDTVSCLLPYFGSGKTPIMGIQRQSIEANMQKIALNGGWDNQSKSYIYSFSFINDNSKYSVACTIQIYDNQLTRIQLGENGKDIMQYEGELKLENNTQ